MRSARSRFSLEHFLLVGLAGLRLRRQPLPGEGLRIAQQFFEQLRDLLFGRGGGVERRQRLRFLPRAADGFELVQRAHDLVRGDRGKAVEQVHRRRSRRSRARSGSRSSRFPPRLCGAGRRGSARSAGWRRRAASIAVSAQPRTSRVAARLFFCMAISRVISGAQRFERLLRLPLDRGGVADGHLVHAAAAGRRVAARLAVARLEIVAQHGPGGEAQRLQVERHALRRFARGRLVRPGPDLLPFLVRAALDEEGHSLKREIVLGHRRHGELRGHVRG